MYKKNFWKIVNTAKKWSEYRISDYICAFYIN